MRSSSSYILFLFTTLFVATPLDARPRSAPLPAIARLVCDRAIFTEPPPAVSRLVGGTLGVAPTPLAGDFDWETSTPGRVREGMIEFQAANQLYGPSASAEPRLKLFRIVLLATAQEKRTLRRAIDRCSRRQTPATAGMTTWSMPERRLLALDDIGSGRIELSASVDQSDIVE